MARRFRFGSWMVMASAAAIASVACDALLDVDFPGTIPPEALDDPRIAPVLVQSAIADFECAYANHVDFVGLFTDELASASFGGADMIDRRVLGPGGNWAWEDCDRLLTPFFAHGLYTPLSTARFQADDALRRIEAFPEESVKDRNLLLATAAAYAGYSYILFGENYCQAAFDLGPALDPPEILERAEARFSTAIALAELAGDAAILDMARVGRARARLDLGRNQEAAEDAAFVRAGFVHHATYSTVRPRRENFVYSLNRAKVTSVAPESRQLDVQGVPDPRVPATDAGTLGLDGSMPVWLQRKYTSASTPIPIASWTEAQLILAEVEGGQAAVDRINALRDRWGLPHFSSTDADEILRQVVEERRRELFLQAHRLNDMKRHGIPLPSGVNHRGTRYGTRTCLPLPAVESDNNPNVDG